MDPAEGPDGDDARPIGSRPFRSRRTWSQRVLLVFNCVVVTGCFASAGTLLMARHVANQIPRVDLPVAEAPAFGTLPPIPTTSRPAAPPESTDTSGTTEMSDESDETEPSTVDSTAPIATPPETPPPVDTFPAADPLAENFLITGADSNACIDPDSRYASAFGDRTGMGERSDTIMVMRVDPATRRAAILSFPRDLYLQISGRSGKSRINNAYIRDDPSTLIATILENFGVGIDHWIQFDFCAFKNLVEGVGGVAVPFEFPVRDENTGLDVPEPGCFTFDGDHALAYVRSRHYTYFDGDRWREDPASDLGRIARQQDFVRRALDAALDRGIWTPSVASSLLEIARENIVINRQLTIERLLGLFGLLRDFDTRSIGTYQIEVTRYQAPNLDVLLPNIDGENMQSILRIFQGIAPLAGAPEQVFDTTTTAAAEPDDSDPDDSDPGESDPDSVSTSAAPTTAPATTTAPAPSGPEENVHGIVPPDIDCGA